MRGRGQAHGRLRHEGIPIVRVRGSRHILAGLALLLAAHARPVPRASRLLPVGCQLPTPEYGGRVHTRDKQYRRSVSLSYRLSTLYSLSTGEGASMMTGPGGLHGRGCGRGRFSTSCSRLPFSSNRESSDKIPRETGNRAGNEVFPQAESRVEPAEFSWSSPTPDCPIGIASFLGLFLTPLQFGKAFPRSIRIVTRARQSNYPGKGWKLQINVCSLEHSVMNTLRTRFKSSIIPA